MERMEYKRVIAKMLIKLYLTTIKYLTTMKLIINKT